MNPTEELIKQRDDEKMRLSAAVDAFAEKMKARLFQKVDEGYLGWDDTGWDIVASMCHETGQLSSRAFTPEQKMRKSVDLADFAMFYHHRYEQYQLQKGKE